MRMIVAALIMAFLLCNIAYLGNLAYGTQFIPYIGVALPKDPKICILDNTDEPLYYDKTQTAINIWTTLLDEKTHSHNWDIKLQVVDRIGMTQCNVSFVFDQERHDWYQNGDDQRGKYVPMVRELGVTTCSDVNPEYCQINIHMLYHTDNEVLDTVVHEFGHALGLGHRVGDTNSSMVAAWLSDDIMFPVKKLHEYVTSDDIDALIKLYGPNGWNDVASFPPPFIIHHPTKVPMYCNHVNATKGICPLIVNP